MSKSIAKKTQNLLVKVLLLLLIVSFGLWGIGDMVTPALQGGSVATVDGEEISAQRVYTDVQRELQQMRQLSGESELDPSISTLIANTVVDRAVNTKLLEVQAGDLDVAISDKLVRDAIRESEIFQDNGTFSRARFDQVMFSNNISEGQYIEIVRADLARQQLMSMLLNGANMPSQAVQDLYRHREERRVVDYLEIKTENMPATTNADTQALIAFYEENKNNYMAPQYRAAKLLHVKPSDVADNIEVPLVDIEDAFSERLNEFRVEEKRLVSQIVFETQTDAQAAIDAMNGGQTFDAVALEKQGLDAASTELGNLAKSELPQELQDATFGLVKGAVSQPIESLLGWHVVTVKEITPGKNPVFEDVQDQLRDELALEGAAEELFAISNDVEDALGGGASIEEAAQTAGFALNEIAAIDAEGLDKAQKAVELTRDFPVIIEEIFTVEANAEPQMRDDGQGGYFMVTVSSITPSTARPFEKVQDLVLGDFVLAEKDKSAARLIKEITDALPGRSLGDLARDKGLIIQTSEPFTRFTSTFAEAITTDIFGASTGNVVNGQTSDGYAVAVLKEIVPFSAATNQAAIDQLKGQLDVSIANDLQAQFVSALRREYAIDINQSLVASMLAAPGHSRP